MSSDCTCNADATGSGTHVGDCPRFRAPSIWIVRRIFDGAAVMHATKALAEEYQLRMFSAAGQRSEVEEYVRREPDADERGTLGCRHPKPCRVTGFAPPGAHPGGHLRESCDNCGSWRLVSPGGAIGSWQRPLLMLRGGG